MKKEFTLIRKDVKDDIVKDKFRSYWWLIALIILFALATIGGLVYSIFAGQNILMYGLIACLVVGIVLTVIWYLSVKISTNNLLKYLFDDKHSKAMEVDILEDKLIVADGGASLKAPVERSYTKITKIKHTNNYTMIFFGKEVLLIIPNSMLYSEEVDYVVAKANANKSK